MGIGASGARHGCSFRFEQQRGEWGQSEIAGGQVMGGEGVNSSELG